MTSSLIDIALAGADQTRAVVMGVGVLDRTGTTFAEQLPGMRAVIVADENTWAAAGPGVEASLRDAGVEPGAGRLSLDPGELFAVRDKVG